MDQPNIIGNPNAGPESPANTKAGSYQSTRTESGSSIASGRGSLNNDCTVPPASAADVASTDAALRKQGL